MPLIKTKVDRNSDDFAANLAVNAALARDLAELSATVMLGGSERSRERHVKRGKLLPRDRVRMLLDDGSPFLEIGQLAAWQVSRQASVLSALPSSHSSTPVCT